MECTWSIAIFASTIIARACSLTFRSDITKILPISFLAYDYLS